MFVLIFNNMYFIFGQYAPHQEIRDKVEIDVSKPTDLWALGAVTSFFCNREHPFKTLGEIFRWKGGPGLFKGDAGQRYGIELRKLVERLLDPASYKRPAAEAVAKQSSIFHDKACKLWLILICTTPSMNVIFDC